MKLWILGGGGLLGRAVAQECLEQGIPHVSSARSECDITDLDTLKRHLEVIQPTHLINCAAYTDVDRAETEAALAYLVNSKGPENLGLLTKGSEVQVVHISTDYVFDGHGTRPYVESDPCRPLGVYAKSKWKGEQNLLGVSPSACVLRTSWLFGKGGKNFISKLLPLMHVHKELCVDAVQRSRPTQCRDLSRALFALLDTGGVFHFANAEEASRYDVACHIHAEALRRGLPVVCEKVVPGQGSVGPAPRPSYSVLGTDKVEAVLKTPIRSWREACLVDF